jgi:hypothetical protein
MTLRTANSVAIVHGLRVWNSHLDRVVVNLQRSDYSDGWFLLRHPCRPPRLVTMAASRWLRVDFG